MISIMEVFGSLMILFVIVIFSQRHTKRTANRENKGNHQDETS
jgi:hypothetical protein